MILRGVVWFSAEMNAKALPNPDHEAMLSELAALGLRGARVVTRMMEIEQASADVVAAWLPEPGGFPEGLAEATAAGQAVDSVDAAMALAVPRVEVLARRWTGCRGWCGGVSR